MVTLHSTFLNHKKKTGFFFCFLYLDFREKAISSNLLEHFNDTIVDVAPEDMYYLLQTFSSMALSRNATDDYEFIERVTLDLFQVNYSISIFLKYIYFICFIFSLDWIC